MKIISIILVSTVICSCDNNSSFTKYAKESTERENKQIEEYGQLESEDNTRMDGLAKIVSKKIKTSSTFQEYFVIVVQNLSNKEITDLQIICLNNSNDQGYIDYIENTFPASVNLQPGEKATITSMPVLNPVKIYIKKIRFKDGTVASRSTSPTF